MVRVQIGLNFILKFCPFRQCESPPSLHWTYKEGLVCPFSKKYIANSTPIAQNIRQKLRNFWVSSTHILPIHCYFQNFSQYSVAWYCCLLVYQIWAHYLDFSRNYSHLSKYSLANWAKIPQFLPTLWMLISPHHVAYRKK